MRKSLKTGISYLHFRLTPNLLSVVRLGAIAGHGRKTSLSSLELPQHLELF